MIVKPNYILHAYILVLMLIVAFIWTMYWFSTTSCTLAVENFADKKSTSGSLPYHSK